MNKFIKNLTLANKDIIEKRALALSEDAKAEQGVLIVEFETELRVLKRKLMDLEDLSPESKVTLKATKDAFDAKLWVRDLHATKIEIRLVEEELETAKETYEEYFGATDEKEL